jgi:hypothetical protein
VQRLAASAKPKASSPSPHKLARIAYAMITTGKAYEERKPSK